MEQLRKSVLNSNANRMLPPRPKAGNDGKSDMSLMKKKRRDYSPLSWSDYFDECKDVAIEGATDVFRVYLAGQSGPVLYFLHGGGHSALSWAVLARILVKKYQCRILAIDLRGHGLTSAKDSYNLSVDTQTSDIAGVFKTVYADDAQLPPTVLVGHSMGGALAVHVAYRKLILPLVGLVVIDVVEGTALDALSAMQNFLRSRPSSFNSVEHAIEWSYRTGQIRNLESARVSVPAQLKECTVQDNTPSIQGSDSNTIMEESDEVETETERQLSRNDNTENNCKKYTWAIDLRKTESHWRGWFEGLSSIFLSCPGPKLLLLAGVDRLDKDLTIGQMQGQFQLQVLPQCGHAIHEDIPDKVGDVLANFLTRNKIMNSVA